MISKLINNILHGDCDNKVMPVLVFDISLHNHHQSGFRIQTTPYCMRRIVVSVGVDHICVHLFYCISSVLVRLQRRTF